MKKSSLLLAVSLLSCGAAPHAVTPTPTPTPTATSTSTPTSTATPTATATATPTALLPAGVCSAGYFSYSEACDGPTATHAVVLADVKTRAAAEQLIAKYTGHLAPGYPFVVATHELPIDDEVHTSPEGRVDRASAALFADAVPRRRGPDAMFRVVAGIFASESAAHDYDVRVLERVATVHRLAGPAVTYDGTGEYESFEATRGVAVAIAHDAPAFATADFDRAEQRVEGSASRDDEDTRWSREIAKLTPACTVRAGQVFMTNRLLVYRKQRRFAPVQCEDGRAAWTPWTATRLESVVRVEKDAAYNYQIVDVMCDSASMDRTPYLFGAPLDQKPKPHASCGRGRS